MTDVLLVSMPFGPVFGPSLGLGLLKAQLARAGVAAGVRYYTIPFAERLGESLYSRIALSSSLTMRELAGEWIFSHELFAQSAEDEDRYVREILVRRDGYVTGAPAVSPGLIRQLRKARQQTTAFLDDCLADVVRRRPRMLGFTSVFQQQLASLALAKRVKAALPDTFIVFGGANCEGVMGAETLRQFDFVDAIVSGEGDLVFPELVARVLAGEPLEGLRGVRVRATLDRDFAEGTFPSAPPVRDLDALPIPDFDDYFDAFKASRFDDSWQPGLFIETSRGCWWGERQHCTFCGLNGATMTFRSKSPERAIEELTSLHDRYPGADMQVVDNILDMGYMKTLLPELARRKLDFGLFYETKSNLKREHLRILRDAGVREIQPGVESFSDPILKDMKKGVTGLQNLQALKWCKEFGVEPLWNLMWGFPGEPPEEYEMMARLLPRLSHLTPPLGGHGLRLDRFSPNFERATEVGFVDIGPLPSYLHVYDLPREAVANLAYYFGFGYRDRHPSTYVGPVLQAIRRWKRVHKDSALFSTVTGGRLVICDLRPGVRDRVTVLDEAARAIFEACESIRSEDEIVQLVASGFPHVDAAGTTASCLTRFDEAGLVVRVGRRVLALAIPLGEYAPSPAAVARFYQCTRAATARTTRRRGPRAPRVVMKRAQRSLAAGDFSFGRHGELVIG